MQSRDDAVPARPGDRSQASTAAPAASVDPDPGAWGAPAPGIDESAGSTAPGPPAENPVSSAAPPDEEHSLVVRVVSTVITAVVVVAMLVHMLFVFLEAAPANQVKRDYQAAHDWWIYPYFEQNWSLFAPNPMSANFRVQAQSRVRNPDGTATESSWSDLTADDLEHIRHNPFPSKADQNMIRRAWESYANNHDAQNEAGTGSRADLTLLYLRRIAVHRFQDQGLDRTLEAVQLRVATTPIKRPGGIETPKASLRVLGWWETSPDDFR